MPKGNECDSINEDSTNEDAKIIACVSNNERVSPSMAPTVSVLENIEDGEVISLNELVKNPSLSIGSSTAMSKAKNASSMIFTANNNNLNHRDAKKSNSTSELKCVSRSYLATKTDDSKHGSIF